ncbi:unnamed protein product, partial [Brugia pahangi]|uniref:PH domain-containing protein n=1 Tax=Brugia pahangi TaxID=6280 RepID=A0A0N4TGA6_BRUPA
EEPSRKSINDGTTGITTTPPETPPPLPESPCPPLSSRKTPLSTPFSIDTSSAHTLRKGWLMLRGKGASDWTKHWVVLAGLSLKLYKDVWAEDSAEPLLSVDLNECENVYPSASAKNYGIEIKVSLFTLKFCKINITSKLFLLKFSHNFKNSIND